MLNDIVRGVIDVRLKTALSTLILTLRGLCERHFQQRDIPVLIHGYANAVPDGRGYLGGSGPLPGPWLRPGFVEKGYPDLARNAPQVAVLIARFNGMLATLPAQPGLAHVRILDVRNALNSDLTAFPALPPLRLLVRHRGRPLPRLFLPHRSPSSALRGCQRAARA